MEGDIDPSANIPPDKSVNNGVTADNVSTNSKPNKLTCNAGNTNIAIESEPEAYNVETELERIVAMMKYTCIATVSS